MRISAPFNHFYAILTLRIQKTTCCNRNTYGKPFHITVRFVFCIRLFVSYFILLHYQMTLQDLRTIILSLCCEALSEFISILLPGCFCRTGGWFLLLVEMYICVKNCICECLAEVIDCFPHKPLQCAFSMRCKGALCMLIHLFLIQRWIVIDFKFTILYECKRIF